jgi:hypothetical protein
VGQTPTIPLDERNLHYFLSVCGGGIGTPRYSSVGQTPTIPLNERNAISMTISLNVGNAARCDFIFGGTIARGDFAGAR